MTVTRWLVPALALLASGCADATRSIGDLGELPQSTPPLYQVERDLASGETRIDPAMSDGLATRVALVIGNQTYQAANSLENPAGDARAMAGLLRENGYRVIEAFDLDKMSFEKALRDLAVEAGAGADVLIFYAGHGFQVDGKDYLAPVDARLTAMEDLPFQTVRLDSMFRMIGAKSRRHVSFLDSCRNNPFEQALLQVAPGSAVLSPELGFGEPQVPGEGLVAFSTEPGEVAFDGVGEPHSPFVTALLQRAARQPDDGMTSLLSQVQRDVERATAGEQTPTWVSRLEGNLSFAAARSAPVEMSLAKAVGTLRRDPTVAPASVTTVSVTASAQQTAAPPVAGGSDGGSGGGSGGGALRIEAPRERTVAIGGRILAALDLPAGTQVTLSGGGTHGGLMTATQAGELLEQREVRLTTDTAGSVFYRLGPQQVATRRSTASVELVVEERLTALIAIPGEAPSRVPVTLALIPDACDVEAGDWFDTQGVGVYRANDVLSPDRAVTACRIAVTRYPEHARFRFQLGKALLASGQLGAAERVLRQAAEMGHQRAWHRLGLLYLERGETARAKAAFEQGVVTWDPPAAVGLAGVLLEGAPLPAEREKAWDLLTYAVDFGLCDAMRTAADYTSDTPNGQAWAARFALEANARNFSCSGGGGGGGANDLTIQYEKQAGGDDGGGGEGGEGGDGNGGY
ncbi:MAG: caspase family protein [Pseudomonadota bacterium]